MNLEYKQYSILIEKISSIYSENYNLYNLLMWTIKERKKDGNFLQGIKDILTYFKEYAKDVESILKYLELKKDKDLTVYAEIRFYFKQFNDKRIDNKLQFI